MLRMPLRFLAVVAIGFGLASGGIAVFLHAAQEPEAKGKPSDSPSAATPPVQLPTPEDSDKKSDWPPVGTPENRQRALQLLTRKAQLNYETAKLNRVLAEISLEEYREVTYYQDLNKADDEIRLAESHLAVFEERLERSKKLLAEKSISQDQKRSEEQALQRAKNALEEAKIKRRILVEFDSKRRILELRSEIELARVKELEKQGIWELQKSDEIKWETLIRSRRKS